MIATGWLALALFGYLGSFETQCRNKYLSIFINGRSRTKRDLFPRQLGNQLQNGDENLEEKRGTCSTRREYSVPREKRNREKVIRLLLQHGKALGCGNCRLQLSRTWLPKRVAFGPPKSHMGGACAIPSLRLRVGAQAAQHQFVRRTGLMTQQGCQAETSMRPAKSRGGQRMCLRFSFCQWVCEQR